MMMNKHISFVKINNICNLNEIHLLNYQYAIDIFELVPKTFVISTNKGKYHFNVEMLKDTSQVISQYLQSNPDQLEYHIDFDDENHILEKIEHLYEGKSVIFDQDDLLLIDQILKISLFSNRFGSQGRFQKQNNYSSIIEISKSNFYSFIENISFQTFTIFTKSHEYKCNSFGILSSKILSDFLIKNPTVDHYNYDFDDNFSEFHIICDIFNFKKTLITVDNIQSLKNIADDLQITYLMKIINKKYYAFEELRTKIDNQQDIIDSIDELFDHLYHINDKTVSKVTEFIIKSPWSSSIEKVKELAAFILQVIKSDIQLHRSIVELLLNLESESKKVHNLSILMPFLTQKLMNSFGESKFNCSFLYILGQKGIVSHEDIENKLKRSSINQNIVDWFLPEISSIKTYNLEHHINTCKKYKQKFLQYYYPNNIEKYKEMLESGEPDDKMTLFILYDDIESFKNIIANEHVDINKNFVPYNIYDHFTENGQLSYLDYATAHGSIKCFKYLLLNHAKLSPETFKYAINSGNSEIIRIINQQVEKLQSKTSNVENLLIQSINKNQNSLFDWIFDENQLNDERSQNLFNKLSLISCENGNAHSLIRIIQQAPDSIDMENIIQACSKNGFFSLLKIIMNLCDVSKINFKSIRESFIVFGNLSIFILYTKYMDQNDFNFLLKHAIRTKCKEIIEYMLKSDCLSAFDDYNIITEYGNMLLKGDGVEINKEEAAKWYKLAADKGNTIAMNNYGYMLANGYGVEINKEEAVKWYKLAADKGNTNAMNNYGNMLLKGDGVEINKEEAVKWYKLAADKGNANAMNSYGYMLANGYGVEINKEEAVKWYKLAADKGNTDAMINYSNMLENGYGVEINKEEAAKWYKLAADKGNTDAMINYGNMLLKGDGVEINKEEAVKWYKLAADKGNTDAMINYSNMLANGYGVEINKEEAAKWYKLAADKGNTKAMNNYGYMLANGYGVEINKEEAVKWYKLAADKGNTNAMNSYGCLLLRSNPENYEEACSLFKMSASKNQPNAMINYGFMMDNGYGTPVNHEKADQLYRTLIENGHAKLFLDFSNLLDKGIGEIPVNLKESLRYCKIAADAGYIEAILKYANMVENGIGTDCNIEEAIKYYKIASDMGNDEANKNYKRLTKINVLTPIPV